MTDPLLHAWLLEIATQPPEAWYGHGRLALADWLEERGDSRADAVRDQAAHDVLKRERDDQIRRRIAAGGLTRGEERILGLAFNVPVRLDDAAGDRERQRLLALFPEVTLTGPCPCHEPLPEGVDVVLTLREPWVNVALQAGFCLWCGNAPRVARASEFLFPGDQSLVVQPGNTMSCDPWSRIAADRIRAVIVRVPAGGTPLRVPARIVLPATNLVGEPL